jgi:hypothetical protein
MAASVAQSMVHSTAPSVAESIWLNQIALINGSIIGSVNCNKS